MRKYSLEQLKCEFRRYFRTGGGTGNEKIQPRTAEMRIQAVFSNRRRDRERENTA